MKKFAAALLALAVTAALALVGAPAASAATHHKVSVRLVTSAGVRIPSTVVKLDGKKDYTARTDARGVAVFPTVNDGTYTAKATFTDKAKKTHTGTGTVSVKATVVKEVKISGLTGIRGVVKKGSTPVVGARVWVSWVGHSTGASAVTASDGSYSVVGMKPGNVTVVAYRAWFDNFFTTYYGNTVRTPDAKLVTLATDVAKVADISVKPSATITGKVVDSHGKPMKGVEVHASTDLNVSGTTSSAGTYYLHGLEAGKVTVYVDRLTSQRDVPTTSSVTAVATLGKTTTAKTLKAVIGTASITFTQKAPFPTLVGPHATLLDSKGDVVATQDGCVYDEDGDCATTKHLWFSGLRSGTYQLSLDGSNTSQKVTLAPGQHKELGTLSIPAPTTVSGTVTDAAKKPLAGIPVDLNDQWGNTISFDTTDSSGHYSIKGIVSGHYQLVTAVRGTYTHAAADLTAVKGKNATANIVVQQGVTLSGVVTHDGKPVAGIAVNTKESSEPGYYDFAFTDSKGRYTIKNIAPGGITVWTTDQYVGGYASSRIAIHGTTPGQHVTAPTIAVGY